MWNEPQDGLFHGTPEDDRQAHGSQAKRNSCGAAAAHARERAGDVGMVADGGEGVFPIPCRARQRGATEGVFARGEAKLAADATATEPAEPFRKAAAAMIGCPTSASQPNPENV